MYLRYLPFIWRRCSLFFRFRWRTMTTRLNTIVGESDKSSSVRQTTRLFFTSDFNAFFLSRSVRLLSWATVFCYVHMPFLVMSRLVSLAELWLPNTTRHCRLWAHYVLTIDTWFLLLFVVIFRKLVRWISRRSFWGSLVRTKWPGPIKGRGFRQFQKNWPGLPCNSRK